MIDSDKMSAGAPAIDPRDYPSLKCTKCGCITFVPAMVIKQIPGILLGKGEKTVEYPVNVMICTKCGEIMESDKKFLKLDNDEKSKGSPIIQQI